MYLFNHTSEIVDQIVIATDDARLYVRESVQRLMNDPIAMGAIPGHLFFENADEQYLEIKQKFNKLVREL